jgi:hypothetical protein
LRRYYALRLCDDGTIQLVKALEDDQTTLSEAAFQWEPRTTYNLWLEVEGSTLRAGVGDTQYFEVDDADSPLVDGGIGLIVEQGTFSAYEVSIGPVGQ